MADDAAQRAAELEGLQAQWQQLFDEMQHLQQHLLAEPQQPAMAEEERAALQAHLPEVQQALLVVQAGLMAALAAAMNAAPAAARAAQQPGGI